LDILSWMFGICCNVWFEADLLRHIAGVLSLVLLVYLVVHCEKHLLVVLVYDWLMSGTCLRLYISEVLAHGLM
jgi:hypothetical protein